MKIITHPSQIKNDNIRKQLINNISCSDNYKTNKYYAFNIKNDNISKDIWCNIFPLNFEYIYKIKD